MFLRCFITFYLLSSLGFSQKADTLRLYYAINEKENARNYQRIDSTLKSLGGTFVDLSITGYADFLCGQKYNYALSQTRADIVKDYFLEKGKNYVNIVFAVAKGESCSKDNQSKEGEPGQRKVDVVIEKATIISVSDSKLKDPEPTPTISPTPTVATPTPTSSGSSKPQKEIHELEVGESVSVEGLNFEPGRHVIRKESIESLKKLLTTLQENQNMKVEIQGHVCCIGDGEVDGIDFDTKEPRLSENRAKAIYQYLIGKGIKADRLSYKGFGGSKPRIWPERSFDDQQVNRRVEIKVLEK